MSHDHISKVNKNKAMLKIERKVQVLESYVKNGVVDFTVPRKFTLNWFVAWEDESRGFEKISKGSGLLQKGSEMHTRIYKLLSDAQEVLEKPNQKTTTKSKSAEKIRFLEADVKRLETLIDGLVQNTVDLMLEIEHYRGELAIIQAQWRDKLKKLSSI